MSTTTTSKTLELSKKIAQEYAMNSSKLLPLRDLQNVLNNDGYYLDELQNLKGCIQKMIMLETKKLESSPTSISIQYLLAKLKVEFWEVDSKVNVQYSLVADKAKHFSEVFLPNYMSELDVCKEHFENEAKRFREAIDSGEVTSQFIINEYKLAYENNEKHGASVKIESDDELSKLELQNILFKELRRLWKMHIKETAYLSKTKES